MRLGGPESSAGTLPGGRGEQWELAAQLARRSWSRRRRPRPGEGVTRPPPLRGQASPSPARSAPGAAQNQQGSWSTAPCAWASLLGSEAGKFCCVAREVQRVTCSRWRPERPDSLAGLPALSSGRRLRSTPGPPSWACAGRAGAPGRWGLRYGASGAPPSRAQANPGREPPQGQAGESEPGRRSFP